MADKKTISVIEIKKLIVRYQTKIKAWEKEISLSKHGSPLWSNYLDGKVVAHQVVISNLKSLMEGK